MESNKVSVIIPFYSGGAWLSEAIESVLNQTYKNIEIIVINDGSKEDLTAFLHQYGGNIIYRYQSNQGAAVARNKGIQLATGKYIAFLDSDDIWLPKKTESQVAFMERKKLMWSHTGFYNWYPDSGILKMVDNNEDYGFLETKILISVKIATPSLMIRSQILKQNELLRFPEAYRKGQDTRFFYEMSKLYPLGLLSEPLVKVRMRGNNSNKMAIARFNFKSQFFTDIKSDVAVHSYIRFIYQIYSFYAKVFGNKSNKVKEFIAKFFWTIPYTLERLYLKLFIIRNKDCKDKDIYKSN